MIRTLLATTAIAALLTGTALAQDASSSMPMDSSMMSSEMPSAMTDSSAMADSSMMDNDTATTARTPLELGQGYTQVDTDRLATKIIGSPVYASGAKDAEDFGKITDLVLNEDGQVAAVVLGVGGFLGIGEKQVAVDFSALQWVVADDGTERFTLQATKDELTSAPDFKTVDDKPVAGAVTAPADTGTMAPADTMSSSAAQ